jgi:hypothetical protein
MKIFIPSTRRNAMTAWLAAAALVATMGAVSAQQRYPAPADQSYGTAATAQPQVAPSRWDRAHFDRSGTRGREGLGASPMHPEGPGNVSD